MLFCFFLVALQRLVRFLPGFWRDLFLLNSEDLFSIISNRLVRRLNLFDSQLNVLIIVFNNQRLSSLLRFIILLWNHGIGDLICIWGIKLIINEVLLSFSFKLLKELLLLLSDMLCKLLGYPVYWKHSRFNALVNITLTIRRRQNDHARETLLGETVYAVVVVFIVHPKIVLLC